MSPNVQILRKPKSECFTFQVTCRDLLNVIQKKTGAEIENLLFHQDNAPVHLAQETLHKFSGFGGDKPGTL